MNRPVQKTNPFCIYHNSFCLCNRRFTYVFVCCCHLLGLLCRLSHFTWNLLDVFFFSYQWICISSFFSSFIYLWWSWIFSGFDFGSLDVKISLRKLTVAVFIVFFGVLKFDIIGIQLQINQGDGIITNDRNNQKNRKKKLRRSITVCHYPNGYEDCHRVGGSVVMTNGFFHISLWHLFTLQIS